jgi:site-specific DNA-methyltransferase (adenine-specific)
MRSLESESVDMIFADPPFNVGKKYGGKASNDNRQDYYSWCADWIAEGFRLLKPTGTFYLMTISRHVFRMGCEMEKHGVFINKIEWRNVSASHGKRGFWPSTQPIIAFGKSEKYKFNTYAQRRKVDMPRWGGYTTQAQGQLLDYWDDIPFVYAGSIAHPEAILKPGTNEKAHPAQMPVNLAARCIMFSTDEGDLVLDPFNGSGTTGEACIKLNRNFIGIEREAEYVSMAKERWARALLSPSLFTPPNNRLHWTGGDSPAKPSQSTLEGFTAPEAGTTPPASQ